MVHGIGNMPRDRALAANWDITRDPKHDIDEHPRCHPKFTFPHTKLTTR